MRKNALLTEIRPFGSSSAGTSTAVTRWKKTTLDQVGVLRCARCQELLSLQLASKWPSLLLSLTCNYEFNQTILIPKFTNSEKAHSEMAHSEKAQSKKTHSEMAHSKIAIQKWHIQKWHIHKWHIQKWHIQKWLIQKRHIQKWHIQK